MTALMGHEPSPHHTKIKDWPEAERPREKLLQRGAHALSDAELLAILIRVGSGKATAVDLARSMLVQEKNLQNIAGKTPQELMRLKGIGEAKAVELVAAFEIGRRVQGMNGAERLVVHSPEDVARFMIPRLRDRKNESFWVLLLDSKNGLMHDKELTVGTLNASLVHPREVFKLAIDWLAAAVIVVHNHPSGNSEPSPEDLSITRQLAEAGKIVGIPLHDHVIVAGIAYTSFAERGLL
ncbi:MAG: DNA repair protein RadC [Bacteroidetes bacterium]|nr:DNA repair protein RadC [Bacteroidota bacterium]